MQRVVTRILFLAWIAVIVIVVVPWTELQNDRLSTRVSWVPFSSFDVGDLAHNILLYVPFGFLYRRISRRPSIGRLSGYACALSAATELTQLFSTVRFPSSTDVICNVIGAMWGAQWAAQRAADNDLQQRLHPADANRDSPAGYVELLIVSAGLVAAMATSALAAQEGGPDAFIVFRYVARWLSGRGLTFNDGEHVEGFTSLTWTLLLAGFARVTRMDVALAAALLNTVVLLASVVMLNRTLQLGGAPRSVRAIALLVFATSYLYFRVSFLGLEFALFGLLLMIFYALLLRGLRVTDNRNRDGMAFSAAGIVGGLLFGTRPEALVILPITLVVLHVRSAASPRRLVQSADAYAVITGSVVVWRRVQYAAWLPNAVVAKSILLRDPALLNAIVQRVISGARYLSDAYMTYPLLAVIILTAIRLAANRGLRVTSILFLVPIVWGYVIVLENGGDWLFGFALVTMYLPVYMLAGWSVGVDVYNRYGRKAVVALTTVALAMHGWANVHAFRSEQYGYRRLKYNVQQSFVRLWPDSDLSRVYEDAGRSLDKVWVPGDILVAESVGGIAYAAPNIYVHDPSGLVDRTLSHDVNASQSVFGRMNWRYTLSLNPAVMLLHFWDHQRPWPSYDPRYPADFERYCLEAPVRTRPPFFLYVIIRKGRPQYAEAIRQIGGVPLNTGTDGHVQCSR